MISVEEALARVLALADRVPEETVPLALASGRAMTRPAIAGRDRAELVAILLAFRADQRPGTIMGRIARGYTPDEIAAMAEQFSRVAP